MMLSSRATFSSMVILTLALLNLPGSETFTRRTSGIGGSRCEEGVRRCLKHEARCEDGVCVCKKGYLGSGAFSCYKPGTTHTEILNDPALRGYDGASVPMLPTCRYLVTHFTSKYTPWPMSTCEVMIHAWNNKHKGKTYVQGFDVALKFHLPIATSKNFGEISLRVVGEYIDGQYRFIQSGSKAFLPDGPWPGGHPTQLYMPGEYVMVKHDPFNNFAHLEVKTCGIDIRYRPPNPTQGKDQSLVPGLFVGIKNSHSPEYKSETRVVSLSPTSSDSLASEARALGLTVRQYLTYRIFTAGVQQNQPNAAPECSLVDPVLRTCNDRNRLRKAFNTCLFMLEQPLFFNCMDQTDNGNTVLGLFRQCLNAVCSDDVPACQTLQMQTQTCAHLNNPDLDNFLLPSTCTF